MKQRKSGVLLAISSLPGDYGIGGFGKEAYAFIDFLAQSRQSIWQILPLGPLGKGNSPYSPTSTYAGNPLYIDLRQLEEIGLLKKEELLKEQMPPGKVNFEKLVASRYAILRKAFKRTGPSVEFLLEDFTNFHPWIKDYALYHCLKSLYPGEWWTWPKPYRDRNPEALENLEEANKEEINFWIFTQYFFFMQWKDLKNYAHAKEISILGDLPFYVPKDSVDVWVAPDLFQLGEDGALAGTPPDYFSQEGQLWGFPVYNWEKMQKDNYAWWLQRLLHHSKQVDILRLDHFNAFATYWSIPVGKSAKEGEFQKGYGAEIFKQLNAYLRKPFFLAEDLGSESETGEKLRKRFGFPGIRVLQFGFGEKGNELHLPHRYEEDLVVYTGTHDNNTIMGWFKDAPPEVKRSTCAYLGKENPTSLDFVRLLMASHAQICIFPVQDLLGLDSWSRMNLPGSQEGNWTWRLLSLKELEIIREDLGLLTTVYRRTFESI